MKNKYLDASIIIKVIIKKQFTSKQMSNKNIPSFNVNVPGGGIQQPAPPLTPTTTIYSTYTGKPVGVGGIPWGTPNDAPPGHHNYNKNFHVIEYNPCNNSYMAHGQQSYY